MAENGQEAAGKRLVKCYRELGEDGAAVVHAALINGKTAKQIAASRGLTGPTWERFFRMRLQECLSTLAVTFGFTQRAPPSPP